MLVKRNNANKDLSKDSKNCFKFLMIPGVLVFIALIVMFNVSLSANKKYDDQRIIKANFIQNVDFTSDLKYFIDEESESPSTVNCSGVCNLECTVRSYDRETLIIELEKKFIECKRPLRLQLKGTPFNETFRVIDLDGAFELIQLTLDKCDKFSRIEDNAFNKRSMHNLDRIEIYQKKGNGIEILSEKTFEGLKLKYLTLRNVVATEKLRAHGFLTPLAVSLEQLFIEQPSVKDSSGYDPRDWLADAIYPKLSHATYTRSYLPGTLNSRVFANLIYVQVMDLSFCSIEFIEDEIFAECKYLAYLYINDNELITLSTPLLEGIFKSKTLQMFDMRNNKWDCSCANKDFVRFIKETNKNLWLFWGKPMCATPDKWAKRLVINVELVCDELATTATATISYTETTSDETTKSINDLTTEITAEDSTELSPVIELRCKSPLTNDPSFDEMIVQDQLTHFHVNSLSASSVVITFKKQVTDHDLFYFTPPGIKNGRLQSIKGVNLLLIEDLLMGAVYVFCLVAPNAQLVTPFNCRSHQVGRDALNKKPEAWLTSVQRHYFLVINISVSIVCFIIGILVIFFSLRCKRKFSKKGEDIGYAPEKNELNDDSRWGYVEYVTGHELPTKQIQAENTSEVEVPHFHAPVLPRSESYDLKTKSAVDMQRKSNGYVEQRRVSELAAKDVEVTNSSVNLAPFSRAPALPPLRTIHLESTRNWEAIKEPFEDHVYQSLDEYDNISLTMDD